MLKKNRPSKKPMDVKQLEQLARNLIADKISNQEIVQMDWAVHEVIKKQGSISGSGVPFYNLCAREFIYTVVKKEVGRYSDDDSNSEHPELRLEGFNHLRLAYTVKRGDERILVPTPKLTIPEIFERADEFRAQAQGLNDHADELISYAKSRPESEAI